MKKALLSVLFVALGSQAFASELYTGRWLDRTSVSIEIVSKSPLTVRYCHQYQCSLHRALGDIKKMKITWGKSDSYPGGEFIVKKRGEHYFGEFLRFDETIISEVTLRKY